MTKKIISSVDDFLSNVGNSLGVSNWLEIKQEMITRFGDATMDHQWIHMDTQKAAALSPYGTTIAHGYLIMSLFPYLIDDIIEVQHLKQVVNYGIDKITFKSPVPVNSRIRLNASIKAARNLGNICKVTYQCFVEVEGNDFPSVEGNIVFIYYF